MSILSQLKPPAGAKRPANRVGRGPGSGNGKTCGRGHNGQNSRSGSGGRRYFEGGQMPLQRRVPKRGFHNLFSKRVVNVSISALEAFDNGSEVTVEALREKRLVKGKFDAVKVLGNGELTKKLTVKLHAYSASAASKIEAAGGKAELIPSKQPKSDDSTSGEEA